MTISRALATACRVAHGNNGLPIRFKITVSIGHGQRGFAEHVEGMRVAVGLVGFTATQRLDDGFAHHKLLTEQAHGEIDAGANHRLAALGNQARQRHTKAFAAVGRGQLAGNHQAPGCRIDEQ